MYARQLRFRFSPARGLVAALLALVACACGGGGGGGGGPPVTLLATLKAVLLGANETTVVDASARSALLLEVRSNGALTFAAAAQEAWVGNVTGLHVHRGGPGTDGPIEVNLLGGGASFDPGTRVASGTVNVAAALAAEIAADPAAFYANVHTSGAPLGLARAQLAEAGIEEAHALLRGSEETGEPEPDARGAATFRAHPDGQVDYVIAMRSTPVPIDELTLAHIHVGGLGVDGGILVDLDVASATLDLLAGTLTHTVTAPMTTLARLCLDPAGYYVNVHTAAAPAGVARGQLGRGVRELWACLSGEEEVPVQDAGARGGAALRLESLTAGRAMLAVQPGVAGQAIGDLIGAHVHVGGAGVNGGVLIDLRAGPDYSTSPSTDTGEGSIAYTPATFARLLADPAGFYVNLHNAPFPGGFVRGQLSDVPVAFFAAMTSAQEVPAPDPDPGHSGSITAIFTGVFRCQFTVEMVTPAPGTLIGGHVHDGPAGVAGPILIDLLGAPGVTVSGDLAFGVAPFTGRTFVRLLAAPERFYANMHDPAYPGGVVRGQLSKVDGDLPPANLHYSESPAVYPEQSAITPNVPASSGGPITAYSVDPPLPAGLVLDPDTGVISGTPTQVTANATYMITGSNAAGDIVYPLDIEVVAVAPTGLSYTSPVTYTQNTAIAPNAPSNAGGKITLYEVSPALPTGLSIDADTGVISGTPTVTQDATDHTVTGSNAAGSTTFDVNITVTAELQPPSNLTYDDTTPTYETGSAITPNSPSASGGAIDSYSVSPSLPEGLTLNTTTGVISGTPTEVTASATYTVTASNAAGDATVDLTIEVVLGPPKGLSYSPNNTVGYVDVAITDMEPTIGGGGGVTYTISPDLPAGLSIDADTGVISGTPTETSDLTTYTVTATNSAGDTTATVQIVVYE